MKSLIVFTIALLVSSVSTFAESLYETNENRDRTNEILQLEQDSQDIAGRLFKKKRNLMPTGERDSDRDFQVTLVDLRK